jgi:hypothetical protein
MSCCLQAYALCTPDDPRDIWFETNAKGKIGTAVKAEWRESTLRTEQWVATGGQVQSCPDVRFSVGGLVNYTDNHAKEWDARRTRAR